VVDVAHVEADFQRKSELIQTKTAVLNDRERQLQLFAHRLAVRERAISLQERQLDTKHTAAQSSLESGTYWQRLASGQQVEKQRGPLTTEELNAQNRHMSAVFERRQHLCPPGDAVQTGSSGLAMEKLEEQFAKLAHSRTTDVLPHQPDIARAQTCVQESAKMQPRPEVAPFHPVNHHFKHITYQSVPTRAYSNVRGRGRPRGSKNKIKMPSESAFPDSSLPIRQQWMRNLYMHVQMVQNNRAAASASEEVVRRGLPHQTIINSKPPTNGGVVAAGCCQNAVKIFSGGRQMLPNEQPGTSFPVVQPSVVSPPLAVVVTQGPPPQYTVMPARVQQLLESAAFTTGASILPPLSPVAAAEYCTSVASDQRNSHFAPDSFQRRRGSRDDNVARKDVAYRVVESTVSDCMITRQPAGTRSEQDTFGNGTNRYPEVYQKTLSDQALPASMAATESVQCDFDPAVMSAQHRNYILPKVSSFDSGHCHSSTQAGQDLSNHASVIQNTGADAADDDDDGRLVVVIDDECDSY